FADPDGRQHADDSAKKRQRHRFEQELISNVAAPGAQRLANADFRGALSNAHQHDIHDADAANHQADRRDRDGDDADHAEDAIELRDKSVRSLYVEVVWLRKLNLPARAQNLLDLNNRFGQMP